MQPDEEKGWIIGTLRFYDGEILSTKANFCDRQISKISIVKIE